MKKIRLSVLTVLAVIALHSAYGQAELAIGVKGGLNFASINTKDAISTYNNRTGYHAGAFVLIKFGKIALQPELVFSQQGSKVKFNTQDYDQNFSYINVPIILKLYLVGGLNLQAGPQFGFLSSANGPNGFNQATGQVTSGDIKSAYKGSDVSIGMGAGWDLPFGLSIDARYNLGVTNNSSGATAAPASSDQVKNQVFQLSLGYKLFKLGK